MKLFGINSRQNLKNHVEFHTEIGKQHYKCHDVCDKSYLRQDRLDRHMEVDIGLQHVCPN